MGLEESKESPKEELGLRPRINLRGVMRSISLLEPSSEPESTPEAGDLPEVRLGWKALYGRREYGSKCWSLTWGSGRPLTVGCCFASSTLSALHFSEPGNSRYPEYLRMGTTFGLLLLCQARQEQWPQGLSSCRSDLEHGTVQS